MDKEQMRQKTACFTGHNLNTHKPASLYKRFKPEEARRITKKLEIHYTPKHGSWLDGHVQIVAVYLLLR